MRIALARFDVSQGTRMPTLQRRPNMSRCHTGPHDADLSPAVWGDRFGNMLRLGFPELFRKYALSGTQLVILCA